MCLLGAVFAVTLSGCNGGTVDRHALTNDAATIDSLSCEGALLAHDVARGRTTKVFARVHAEELQTEASNLTDALSTRKTEPSIERRVREKAKEAAALAATLRRLHDHPTDRDAGAAIERTLERMGHCP